MKYSIQTIYLSNVEECICHIQNSIKVGKRLLSLCVPLLYCIRKEHLKKLNSFGEIIDLYVSSHIIFIKMNTFETMNGLFDKLVIWDVLFKKIVWLLLILTTVHVLLE